MNILDNHNNNGTLNLDPKYIMEKSEVKYNNIKDKVKFK